MQYYSFFGLSLVHTYVCGMPIGLALRLSCGFVNFLGRLAAVPGSNPMHSLRTEWQFLIVYNSHSVCGWRLICIQIERDNLKNYFFIVCIKEVGWWSRNCVTVSVQQKSMLGKSTTPKTDYTNNWVPLQYLPLNHKYLPFNVYLVVSHSVRVCVCSTNNGSVA
jgi:hypothetical protein